MDMDQGAQCLLHCEGVVCSSSRSRGCCICKVKFITMHMKPASQSRYEVQSFSPICMSVTFSKPAQH